MSSLLYAASLWSKDRASGFPHSSSNVSEFGYWLNISPPTQEVSELPRWCKCWELWYLPPHSKARQANVCLFEAWSQIYLFHANSFMNGTMGPLETMLLFLKFYFMNKSWNILVLKLVYQHEPNQIIAYCLLLTDSRTEVGWMESYYYAFSVSRKAA